jgi:hypothetical protein
MVVVVGADWTECGGTAIRIVHVEILGSRAKVTHQMNPISHRDIPFDND